MKQHTLEFFGRLTLSEIYLISVYCSIPIHVPCNTLPINTVYGAYEKSNNPAVPYTKPPHNPIRIDMMSKNFVLCLFLIIDAKYDPHNSPIAYIEIQYAKYNSVHSNSRK